MGTASSHINAQFLTMADDGMVLNFQLGAEPLKRQVKFTGGRWRDRKRAEKSARGGGQGPTDNVEIPERAPKRQRVDDDAGSSRPFKSRSFGARPGGARPGEEQKQGGGGHAGKGDRQVISSLFSHNPAQKTVFEEEQEEWKAPEATNAPLSDVASFGTLSLASRLVDELSKMELQRPTAIQSKVIPHLLEGSGDAFVQAQTGSGKTFAYLLPILHRVLQLSKQGDGKQIHRDSGVFAIIVAPTRELARQTDTVLEALIRPFPWLVSTAITGGESKKAEKARIRKGVNFLVATPGRLADHIDNTKALTLSTVRWLILDEGDRLMDLGFEDDLKTAINALKRVQVENETPNGASLEALPERRVTVLCSATMKMNVQKLGEMSLADATFLAAEKDDEQIDNHGTHKAPAQLHQSHIIVPAKLRLVTLISYLRSVFSRRGRTMKAIIFMACADSVDFHYELLKIPQKTNKDDTSKTKAAEVKTSKKPQQLEDSDEEEAEEAEKTQDPAKPDLPESVKRDQELLSKTVAKASYVTTPASPQVILHRMHGSLTQSTRTATIKSFSACKEPSVLITTDVSSRGLDIPSVDLVIEYDPAFSFADHIHRVGRTARAGRPGDAVLFLQPGTEEGYIDLLKTSGSVTNQPFETVLEKGNLSKINYPVQTSAAPPGVATDHKPPDKLQLHLEQRILNDPKQLDLARNGFKSHIRAYATHTKEERQFFDITELHLGHTAKSFGLREPPSGIGAGLDKKAKRNHKGGKDTKGGNSSKGGASKGDFDENTGMDEKASHDLFKKKSRMLMSAGASEFNIG